MDRNDGGLNKYEKKTDRFIRVRSIGSTTLDIVQEEDSTLWFATWGKRFISLLSVTEEWKHYSVDKKSNEYDTETTWYYR
jgi:hypothetical protein